MNERNPTPSSEAEDAVEALLEKASPRAAPPESVKAEIRAAVHGQWQAATTGRRRKRSFAGWAVAASVLIAATLVLTSLREPAVPVIDVASVIRSPGNLALLSADGSQVPLAPGDFVSSGQTVVTAIDSGAGLEAISGGSLRIDRNSRVEWISANEVYLHSGRLYFDSQGANGSSRLMIRTAHGTVRHLGTQFMTATTPTALRVSVREGLVHIDGVHYEERANAGQVVELVGSARAQIYNTSGAGGEWEWVESLAPPIDLAGRSTHEFLEWVGRETGFTLRYSGSDAEQLARTSQFHGDIQGHPRRDLRLWMMTIDLVAEFDEQSGELQVRLVE